MRQSPEQSSEFDTFCALSYSRNQMANDVLIGVYLQAAVSLGINVMSEEWIHRCWEFRDDINVLAADEHLVSFVFPLCSSVSL